MTVRSIENIITGYISELRNNGIHSFSYYDGVLYITTNELTEQEYKLVDFVSELIILKCYVQNKYGRFTRYDVADHIAAIKEKYSHEIVTFYPLSCAVDSVLMDFEKEVV